MRARDDVAKRKHLDFPHFCAVEVPLAGDQTWGRRSLEMEIWCRQRVGATEFAKQGRMGSERDRLEYRFKSPEIATEFQAAFGGAIGPPMPPRAKISAEETSSRPPSTIARG